jgi:hypothetical protein
MGRADRERELRNDRTRLKASLSAIHDALHANDVNRAHEFCECALEGKEVSQPNLSVADASKSMSFAADFNKLAQAAGVRACCVMALPSATIEGHTSLQLCGDVAVCRIVERAIRASAQRRLGATLLRWYLVMTVVAVVGAIAALLLL